MQKLIDKTDVLIDKAHKLAEQIVKLRLMNTIQEKELKDLKAALDAEMAKTAELNNKIKIIKLAQNINSAKPDENREVTDLKRKINGYIKEIDNCIAMLND
jgi:hypothetical protein